MRVDPKVFAHGIRPECVVLPAGRVAVFRGEHGFVDREHTREHCGPGVPVTTLPQSGHHPMLDQPLALVAALRTRLDDWATAP
jgi:pimeloyl-ACP methyl ester carboxylesterase